MAQDKKYTAYCGLFCKDCIPANEPLFKLIDKLEMLLSALKGAAKMIAG